MLVPIFFRFVINGLSRTGRETVATIASDAEGRIVDYRIVAWLLVTKRPENLSKFLPQGWLSNPKPNVWLMTTCENQECADKRIPELMKVPAVVYGISVEPMLGPIVLPQNFLDLGRSGWVIAGGESGSSARTTQKEWLTGLRDQCVSHGVAYFFKKWGKFFPDGNNVRS